MHIQQKLCKNGQRSLNIYDVPGTVCHALGVLPNLILERTDGVVFYHYYFTNGLTEVGRGIEATRPKSGDKTPAIAHGLLEVMK